MSEILDVILTWTRQSPAECSEVRNFGKAYGNIFNFADTLVVDQPPIVGGQVVLDNSHEDPVNLSLGSMKISMGFSHAVTATFQPVLQNLIKRRPEVADSNVTLLTWDNVDGIWYLKGPYEFALEQNEDVKWFYNKEKWLPSEGSYQAM
ncbi:uncharacterized protein LACBIDRAFT_333310 [Laccaria bicolor S238N-H82]|uniref:Predicted protein n=1 Tax=Laccaria bicolor (strain S238N-H82 / ATCC MYA-4686) TaxID=486041 RepID=B0DVJ3_LACBS|nr:uncharacterized protein LACBIDRAFT_333310 [Laccaria bicolor S238N-H82]EDR01428.1 predicted protein [Laccaria bicolor S238N-H82]|eukprot:XP_001887973.1 predicted protein [Laccaria bicolor S238N-H82]